MRTAKQRAFLAEPVWVHEKHTDAPRVSHVQSVSGFAQPMVALSDAWAGLQVGRAKPACHHWKGGSREVVFCSSVVCELRVGSSSSKVATSRCKCAKSWQNPLAAALAPFCKRNLEAQPAANACANECHFHTPNCLLGTAGPAWPRQKTQAQARHAKAAERVALSVSFT